MQKVLFYFSVLFVLIQLALVFIPYLQRKMDLINSWTLFSIGAACFIGLSGVNAAIAPAWYAQYSRADYLWYFSGVIVFFTAASVVYYYVKWPSHVAVKRFRKWPPSTQNALMVMLLLGGLISLGFLFPAQVQGIGQFVSIVGKNGVIIMCVAAMILWLRQPVNPATIILLFFVFSYSFGLSVMAGSGRRDMVAVLSVIPIVLYWCVYRRMNSAKATAAILILAVPAILVVNGYSSIRHDLQKEDKTAMSIIQMARQIPSRMFDAKGAAQMMGQNATEASLLAIHIYKTEKWPGFDVKPFFTVKYILVNPIPRAFWPNKPESLGVTLPRDTGLQGGTENWGPGIVGHGFHEGGLPILLIYGICVGAILKLFDTLLCLYPSNPFLISILAANAGQIIGWTRGGIGGFSVLIIGGVIAVWVVVRIVRTVCGTEFNQVQN